MDSRKVELAQKLPIMGCRVYGLWIVGLVLLFGLWSPRIMAAPSEQYKDYAFAQLGNGDTMWLGSSPLLCPAGQLYGWTETYGKHVKNKFCWRLNKYTGYVEIAGGRWKMAAEQFNWTIDGAGWLKSL